MKNSTRYPGEKNGDVRPLRKCKRPGCTKEFRVWSGNTKEFCCDYCRITFETYSNRPIPSDDDNQVFKGAWDC